MKTLNEYINEQLNDETIELAINDLLNIDENIDESINEGFEDIITKGIQFAGKFIKSHGPQIKEYASKVYKYACDNKELIGKYAKTIVDMTVKDAASNNEIKKFIDDAVTLIDIKNAKPTDIFAVVFGIVKQIAKLVMKHGPKVLDALEKTIDSVVSNISNTKVNAATAQA